MAKTLYQNKNGTLEPISWMPFVSTTEAELQGKTYPKGTIIHVTDGEENTKKYSFSGTPNSNGFIITNCPKDVTPLNVIPKTLSRLAWDYVFVSDDNVSSEYWCIHVLDANSSSGTFSGQFYGIKL